MLYGVTAAESQLWLVTTAWSENSVQCRGWKIMFSFPRSTLLNPHYVYAANIFSGLKRTLFCNFSAKTAWKTNFSESSGGHLTPCPSSYAPGPRKNAGMQPLRYHIFVLGYTSFIGTFIPPLRSIQGLPVTWKQRTFQIRVDGNPAKDCKTLNIHGTPHVLLKRSSIFTLYKAYNGAVL